MIQAIEKKPSKASLDPLILPDYYAFSKTKASPFDLNLIDALSESDAEKSKKARNNKPQSDSNPSHSLDYILAKAFLTPRIEDLNFSIELKEPLGRAKPEMKNPALKDTNKTEKDPVQTANSAGSGNDGKQVTANIRHNEPAQQKEKTSADNATLPLTKTPEKNAESLVEKSTVPAFNPKSDMLQSDNGNQFFSLKLKSEKNSPAATDEISKVASRAPVQTDDGAKLSQAKQLSQYNNAAIDITVQSEPAATQAKQPASEEQGKPATGELSSAIEANIKPSANESPEDGQGGFSSDGKGSNSGATPKDISEGNSNFNLASAKLQGIKPGSPAPEKFTTSKTTATIKTEEFIQKTTQLIKKLPNHSSSTARLMLKPESLGTIHVEIRVNDNKVNIKIKADTKEAADIIESQIAQLRDKLAQQGLKAESVDVYLFNQDTLATEGEKSGSNGNQTGDDAELTRDFLDSFKYLNDEAGQGDESVENAQAQYNQGKLIEIYI